MGQGWYLRSTSLQRWTKLTYCSKVKPISLNYLRRYWPVNSDGSWSEVDGILERTNWQCTCAGWIRVKQSLEGMFPISHGIWYLILICSNSLRNAYSRPRLNFLLLYIVPKPNEVAIANSWKTRMDNNTGISLEVLCSCITDCRLADLTAQSGREPRNESSRYAPLLS